MKKMFVVNPDGNYTVNPTEDPRYADMVVYHTDEGNLKIEAPATGNCSTADQRKTVNELAGKWLESKVAKIGAGGGEIVIKENAYDAAEGISVPYIIASIDGGKLSDDEAVAGAGLIGQWVGKTAKKDTAKKPADTKATPPADPKKPADTKATPPADSADSKATPPADPADTKATPPADSADTKATPPADPVEPATKKDGVHWDPNLSVDENIDRIWNAG